MKEGNNFFGDTSASLDISNVPKVRNGREKNFFFVDWDTITLGGESKNNLIEELGSRRIICDDKTSNFVFGNIEKDQKDVRLVKFRAGYLATAEEKLTLGEVVKRAKSFGLELCPRETAVFVALKVGRKLSGPIGILSKNNSSVGFVNVDYFEKRVEMSYLDNFNPDMVLDRTEELVMVRKEI